jgi:hypothetical protein
MKFVNHTHKNTNIANGTCLQGYIRANYNDLVRVFGEPNNGDGGYKVQAEWNLKFSDGTVATIYDWKEDRSPKYVRDWHIGGFNKKAVDLVHKAFDTALVS